MSVSDKNIRCTKGFGQNTVRGFVLQLFYIHKSLVTRHSVSMLGSQLVSLAAVIRDTKAEFCRGSFNSCPLSRAPGYVHIPHMLRCSSGE